MTKVEQQLKAWNDFATEVAEYIKANISEMAVESQERLSLETLTGGIRRAGARINSPQYLDARKQECFAAAHSAQLAWERLKPFSTRQAVEYLKQGKSVRPAHEPCLVVLTVCEGDALSRFINRDYTTLEHMPSLPFKDHFIVVWQSSEVTLTRELPTYTEWVLARDDEIKQAATKAMLKKEREYDD